MRALYFLVSSVQTNGLVQAPVALQNVFILLVFVSFEFAVYLHYLMLLILRECLVILEFAAALSSFPP